MGCVRFAVRLSYCSTETTRHMHISDEAGIKDEGGGVEEAGNRDRLCALAEARGAAG